MKTIGQFVLMAGVLIVTLSAQAFSNDAMVGQVNAQRRDLDILKGLPREWSGTSARDCKTYEHKNI